jgi:hypothetical protein
MLARCSFDWRWDEIDDEVRYEVSEFEVLE